MKLSDLAVLVQEGFDRGRASVMIAGKDGKLYPAPPLTAEEGQARQEAINGVLLKYMQLIEV